jgi:hypothetical protein
LLAFLFVFFFCEQQEEQRKKNRLAPALVLPSPEKPLKPM